MIGTHATICIKAEHAGTARHTAGQWHHQASTRVPRVACCLPRVYCIYRRTPRSLATLLLAPPRLSHPPRRPQRRTAGQNAWMGCGRYYSMPRSCCKVSLMSWHTPCACWLSCGRCCSQCHLTSSISVPESSPSVASFVYKTHYICA